ncbi:hypothetical protein DL767_009955 [Monosporascus sp. MG133]|nr:hypothetical protein DL767_009955 [Monosporascus sp. MG133]
MPPENELRTWTCQIGDFTYTVSTDPRLVQLDEINAAFALDMVYWAKPLPLQQLRRCVENCLCFGLYFQEGGDMQRREEEEAAGQNNQKMIGLARLVTDYVTFGYLTDVYVLPEHQGKGLGRWMMECLGEVLDSWPDLRRCVLFTRGAGAVKLYRETIGAKDLSETPSASLIIMERPRATVKVEGKEEEVR